MNLSFVTLLETLGSAVDANVVAVKKASIG